MGGIGNNSSIISAAGTSSSNNFSSQNLSYSNQNSREMRQYPNQNGGSQLLSMLENNNSFQQTGLPITSTKENILGQNSNSSNVKMVSETAPIDKIELLMSELHQPNNNDSLHQVPEPLPRKNHRQNLLNSSPHNNLENVTAGSEFEEFRKPEKMPGTTERTFLIPRNSSTHSHLNMALNSSHSSKNLNGQLNGQNSYQHQGEEIAKEVAQVVYENLSIKRQQYQQYQQSLQMNHQRSINSVEEDQNHRNLVHTDSFQTNYSSSS